MDWANKNANPEKLVSLGQEINVKILDIDPERRRISLGIKQCEKNPWVEFINNHKTGEHIKGEIKSITDFGVFIGLENGIDGLVHLSDLSWTIPGEEAVKKYKKGDQLETILLSADPERERISLGVKQLTDNPFADFMDKNPKNSVMQLVVKEKDEKQLSLDVGGDISGVIKKEEFADIDQISKVQVGETLDLMVLNFDKKNQTVYFSQKALEQKNTSEVLDKIAKENEENKATLGDIIKDQIDN